MYNHLTIICHDIEQTQMNYQISILCNIQMTSQASIAEINKAIAAYLEQLNKKLHEIYF